MIQIGIDTSVLIGLLDPKDIWHGTATALKQALKVQDADVAVFDCVLIALSCRHRGIRLLASFDRDFDRLEWLQRVARPDDLG